MGKKVAATEVKAPGSYLQASFVEADDQGSIADPIEATRSALTSCEICNKTVKTSPSQRQKGRGRFCSRACFFVSLNGEGNPHWTGGKLPVTIVCACCEVEFNTTATDARMGRKFCGQACSNTIKNQQSKKNDTAPERTVREYLEQRNIKFQSQVPLCGVGLVDFLVGTTIIQCDGVYWHTLPGRQEHDLQQDEALNEAGYTVIRVNDEEMKELPIELLLRERAWVATAHNQRRVSWQI